MRPKTVIQKFFEITAIQKFLEIRRLMREDGLLEVGCLMREDGLLEDGLLSLHNHDFMKDPSFCKAYERGCGADYDYKWHWRVHIGLWAAVTAGKLAGDFVECGVGHGFMSSAIMEFLDWDSLNKTFYLLDTFAGADPRYISQEDEQCRIMRARYGVEYESARSVESVKANFSQWKNTRIIRGSIPDTLNQVDTQNVAYLHLDMNCSPPEIAAINFFWDRLVPGAVVLLDDYAYRGYESQKHAMDAFGKGKQVIIASLPTGQGLLMKPPKGTSSKT